MNDNPQPEIIESSPPGDSGKPDNISLSSVVWKIANSMLDDRMPTGDLADLRRVDPEKPYTPALWKILGRETVQKCSFAPPEYEPDDRERQWAALLMGMAMTAGFHDTKTPVGSALAESGWSALRFERLMRQRDADLFTEIRRMASYLASKSAVANWTDIAWLLFVQEGEGADKVRRRIARNYYQTLYRIEKK